MSDPEPPGRAWNERAARPALALGAGTLVALSMPPWGFWPLAIVGIALFEVALGAGPSRRDRLVLGVAFGAGWMYLGMGWMVQLTLPGYVVAGAVFAVFHMAAALVAPAGVLGVIGRPAAHAVVEAVRFSFPFGGIPLATLGMSQVGGPLVGVVRVGGVILLTWLVFQLSIGLAAQLGRMARGRPFPAMGGRRRADVGAAGLVAVAAVLGLAVVAPTGAPTGETLSIAAVQGGGEQGTRAIDVPASVVTERHLETTAAIPAGRDLDFVLWPENTIREDVFDGSPTYDAIAEQARRLDAPIAVGVTEQPRINSQTLVSADGDVVDRYVKVRRVPFGEYVPLRTFLESVGAPVEQIGRDAVVGTGPAVLDLPGGPRLAVVISWEVFFAGRAREGVRLGGEAILNPTNGASYTGTIVQTQQVASSRLRALETGRWVAQAAPTGFTAIVDADGTVRQRTAVSERNVLYDDIELRTGRTWYVDLGEAPFIAALVLLFGASWLGTVLLDRRRDPDPTSTPDSPALDTSPAPFV